MPTLHPTTNDGYVSNQATGVSWGTVRDAATGTGSNTNASNASYAVRSDKMTGRGSILFSVSRSFFHFQTSEITSSIDTKNLQIVFRGQVQEGGDVILVKATSDISSLALADFDAIEGWSTGDNETNVTKYSSVITNWDGSGTNIMYGTNELAKDMLENNDVYLCLINYDHDLKDVEPTDTMSAKSSNCANSKAFPAALTLST